jgi:DNA adenine methylase
MRLSSPIGYAGGKGNMVAKLLKLLPPHKYYCEVFGGRGTLLLAKPPVKVEVYNDIHSDLVNLFRVIRDKDKFQEFHRIVSLTPYSREEFYYCRDTIDESKTDIERAYKFFIKMRQSFAGNSSSWGFNVKTSGRNMSRVVSNYLFAIDMLPLIHKRLQRVQIEHDDFRKIIPRYDSEDNLFYCDPPYPLETRTGKLYEYEMSIDDHKDLVELLLKCKSKIMLSCYWHEVYQPLIKAGWTKYEFKTACYLAGKTRNSGLQGDGSARAKAPRTEVVIVNYDMRLL